MSDSFLLIGEYFSFPPRMYYLFRVKNKSPKDTLRGDLYVRASIKRHTIRNEVTALCSLSFTGDCADLVTSAQIPAWLEVTDQTELS